MPNNIRTPRRGITRYSNQIADAVDNEAWQRLRISLKGKTTEAKVERLKKYLSEPVDAEEKKLRFTRVDNYLKALARGGFVILDGNLFEDNLSVAIRR